MKRFLNLTIVTPEGIVFEGEVDRIELPGTLGSFMVMPMHAALISSLTAGEISYVKEGKSDKVVIKGGFVEVKQDTVSVCVEQ